MATADRILKDTEQHEQFQATLIKENDRLKAEIQALERKAADIKQRHLSEMNSLNEKHANREQELAR